MEQSTKKIVWISWSYQRRSVELSRAFSARFYYFDQYSDSRIKRYLFYLPRTIQIFKREKPDILFTQNPSLALVILAILLKPIFRYILVNDLHTPYIRLKEPLHTIFWNLQKFCVRRSDLTLVTNIGVKNLFEEGNIAILPDKLPSIPGSNRMTLAGDFNVLYICSFSEDEPYEKVLAAAGLLDNGIHIYVTGPYVRARWSVEDSPSNLHLTGFLPEEYYFELLISADTVMVLTNQEDCLVCGGYEGVAAGKPLILSDHKALRSYFSRGVVFVDNDAGAIASGINESRMLQEKHQTEIELLRNELDVDWTSRFESIRSNL